MKSTSLAIGSGGLFYNSTEMSRKEANERTKKLLLAGAFGFGLYWLTRPATPRINNLAVVTDDPLFAEGYTFARNIYDLPNNDGTMLAGVLGATDYSPGVLPVSDDVSVPLKLRRMQVVRADAPINTAALRVLTQNTMQRAKRANRDVPNIVRGVVKRYGTAIKQAALLHNVPAEVIATKICIENPDLLATVVTGGGATGIMQIAPGTADDCLRTEYRKGALTELEQNFFRQQLGQDAWAALLRGQSCHRTFHLQRPLYNIHIGTLAFGQMLRKYTNLATGEVELYKAAAEYNRGIRAEGPNKVVSSPDQLIGYRNGKLSTPAITQQYIMLYCGPGGPLDYITRNNSLS